NLFDAFKQLSEPTKGADPLNAGRARTAEKDLYTALYKFLPQKRTDPSKGIDFFTDAGFEMVDLLIKTMGKPTERVRQVLEWIHKQNEHHKHREHFDRKKESQFTPTPHKHSESVS